MNDNALCPVCHNQNQLKVFHWHNYNVIHCHVCKLDFCMEMIYKEEGGNSSPVPLSGIKMMSESFYKTKKIANNFAIKRKSIK